MKNFILYFQAGKFVLVGVLNTLIDLGVLNLLIFATGIASGLWYTVFKGISFIAAVINSYILNKFWTFKSAGQANKGKEFAQFLTVSIVGFGINVGVASLVVNVISQQFPSFGVSEQIWANIGAISATFCAMAWNFIGYKFIVFKR
jgi:putative flippase GtrA